MNYRELYWNENDLLACNNACRRIICNHLDDGWDEEEILGLLIEMEEAGCFGNLDVIAVWEENQ